MKTIYLHIGTHKTGSTALQRWLDDNRQLLSHNGYRLFTGRHIQNNHIELYLATMRYNRDSFGKQSLSHLTFDANYTAGVTAEVRQFIQSSPESKLIFTSEGLSLLRHEDEFSKLKDILGHSNRTEIIVYLRNKADYLAS